MLLKLAIAGSAALLPILAQVDASTIASAASHIVPGAEPALVRYGAMGVCIIVLCGLLAAERWQSVQRSKEEREERRQMREAHAKHGEAMATKVEAAGEKTASAIKEYTAEVAGLSAKIDVLADRQKR